MSQPFNVIYASKIGAVLDCVVNPVLPNVGKTASGGAATDNTSVINNALLSLAAVGVGSVKMILDGGTLTTGLILPQGGHYEIEGLGQDSGIFMAPGSNSDAIYNGAQPPTIPGTRGGSVTLSNFTVNGNRGNGSNGNCTSGDPRFAPGTIWKMNISLWNISTVRIKDMYIYDSPTYAIELVNCADVVVANNLIFNPCVTFTPNNDGIHVDGPGADVRIMGNTIYNNFSDDAIAINSPEAYGGTIDRVTVVGNTFNNTATAMRVYGNTDGEVPKVVFSDNVGSISSAVLFVGVSTVGSTPDLAVRNLVASSNIFTLIGTGTSFLRLEGGSGDIVLTDCVWQSPAAAGSFVACDVPATISSLTLNNCRIYRTVAGNNTSSTFLTSSQPLTIKKLTLNGLAVVNEQGTAYAAIANALAMTNVTITSLFVASLDYTNITNLADSFTFGSLAGAYANKQVIAANKTGAYTVIPTDAYLRGDATTATFAFTLPAAPYLYEEHDFQKVDSSANAVTIAGNGKTINGAASLGTQWSHAKMRYNGASWDSL